MNANERRFIARVYIALNRLFFFCGAVQESGGITAKRAESAKRWRRGGEGRMDFHGWVEYWHIRVMRAICVISFIDLKQIIKIFPGFTASAVFLIIWTSCSPILDHILLNSLLEIATAIFALPVFTVFIRQILNEFFGEEILDRDDVFFQ